MREDAGRGTCEKVGGWVMPVVSLREVYYGFGLTRLTFFWS